ncbi:MAG TPA: bifunctional 5,10-methylenetetrahydrofolate dehydrogenase/5,10-methenyltetrahydrofolate cyclohydrolase [Phycisphaerales bacterium]|nr:bifunctional 5,10-methylenetetrahydrofolate dehydrogenase/5,10-methenyltetrahydrofolate cyclohydrolase [Phycisphaerales bacterium]
MSAATIIDGKALAARQREQIRERAARVRAAGASVRLDAILVESGDNGARVYAENQAKTCVDVGIDYRLHRLAPGAAYDDIAGRVLLLSADDSCHAIMMHVPLPEGVDTYRVQRLIHPDKDVEGVNPANIGNIVYGRSSLAPCTALAVVKMIEHVHAAERPSADSGGPLLRGKAAVVVGASDVVGKPIAVLLMRHDATVISCNKWTPALAEYARSADVLVAAAGKPGLITAEMIKRGATVIDVGVNRVTGPDGKAKTVGDVSFEQACHVAGAISPVPGGVGPMTVAMLLLNVVEAAERRAGMHP